MVNMSPPEYKWVNSFLSRSHSASAYQKPTPRLAPKKFPSRTACHGENCFKTFIMSFIIFECVISGIILNAILYLLCVCFPNCEKFFIPLMLTRRFCFFSLYFYVLFFSSVIKGAFQYLKIHEYPEYATSTCNKTAKPENLAEKEEKHIAEVFCVFPEDLQTKIEFAF